MRDLTRRSNQPSHYGYPDGWFVGRDSWHFCRRLYDKYSIVLEYGEYTTISRTIQRGFGMRIPGTRSGTTVFLIKFRYDLLLPVLVAKNGRLLSVLSGREFLDRLSRHMGERRSENIVDKVQQVP